LLCELCLCIESIAKIRRIGRSKALFWSHSLLIERLEKFRFRKCFKQIIEFIHNWLIKSLILLWKSRKEIQRIYIQLKWENFQLILKKCKHWFQEIDALLKWTEVQISQKFCSVKTQFSKFFVFKFNYVLKILIKHFQHFISIYWTIFSLYWLRN
jgi:hypothetical protein